MSSSSQKVEDMPQGNASDQAWQKKKKFQDLKHIQAVRVLAATVDMRYKPKKAKGQIAQQWQPSCESSLLLYQSLGGLHTLVFLSAQHIRRFDFGTPNCWETVCVDG